MNRQAQAYWALVSVIGVSILGWAIASIPPGHLLALAFLVLVSIFVELLPVKLPRGGAISVSFAANYAAIILYGPAVAICSSAAGGIISCIRRKGDFQQFAFNVGQICISAWGGGAAFVLLGGDVGVPNLVGDALPLLGSALSYFLLNCTLVTGLLSLIRKERFLSIWLMNVKWLTQSYLALAPLGFLIAAVYSSTGVMGTLLFFVPLLLARYSFQQYMNMREVYIETVKAFGAALEAKDEYTRGHSERVSNFATAIAREMKLPEPQVEELTYAGYLHDIGKIGIPDYLLNKKGELNQDEFSAIKTHVVKGAGILNEIRFLRSVAQIIQCHHERVDGTGYPAGLRGEEIPLGARILAVADAFDAMTSDRPYRPAFPTEEALRRILAARGKQFDSQVVEAIVRVLAKEDVKVRC